jgi:hypothetical protein
MFSDTFLTKVTLQHLLYPTVGNTYDPQIQPPSRTNYFPNTMPDIKNVPVYGIRQRIDVSAYDLGNNGESDSSIDVLHHEEYPSKNRTCSSQKNTIGLLRATESRWS